ncbi:hypothetical protein V1512DRAFT_251296 [Lipomyces arxii]|uniref:uncharacterized protein n=1 Tax=Lipomyces arxii TaxID=56418 RepID=UPI0034CFE27E
MTTGYDSIMNGLQFCDPWLECAYILLTMQFLTNNDADFNQLNGVMLGLLSAVLSIDSLAMLSFAPFAKIGRKKAVVFGSIIVVIGEIIQTYSVNSKLYAFVFYDGY